MLRFVLFLVPVLAVAQTVTNLPAPAPAIPAPSYFSVTGGRFSYYDQTITETTKLGVHVSGASKIPDTPAGLWVVAAVDATPRSLNPTAALRGEARYYVPPIAGGNIVVYANIAAGGTTTTSTAISAAGTGSVSSSLLGNLQGGMGFVWRACHTFNPRSKINCVLDLDYEINSVLGTASAPPGGATASTPVKPIIGIYMGLMF